MAPVSEEEKAARRQAAQAKRAAAERTAHAGGAKGDDTGKDAGMEPARRFQELKAAQKAQSVALSESGERAGARLAAQREAVKKEVAQQELPPPVNRREFLMYAWTASIALLLAGSGVTAFYFALPRFGVGELGGIFPVPVSRFPEKDGEPVPNDEGKFWLVHTEAGYNVLYKVCTHLGCLYNWVSSNNRFECPCHGSKFERDGQYIEGPAPRGLDRYKIVVRDRSGQLIAENDSAGDPVVINDPEATVLIDTSIRINGPAPSA